MGGEAQAEALGAVEAGAGQSEELAGPPRQARQIPAAADVGEQADRRLRHGEAGVLGGDPVFARLRDSDSAAHGDPVHEGDGRLGVGEEEVVEPIFLVEEGASLRPVAGAAPRQHDDIAAGAEASAFGMVDHHRLHRLVLAPGKKRGDHRAAHVAGEGMDRLRAVEADPADLAFGAGDEVGGHDSAVIASEAKQSSPRGWRRIDCFVATLLAMTGRAHCLSMSRATIIRMTWLVPSRIEWTRRSRQKRSIG
jgi:hypothetical protein